MSNESGRSMVEMLGVLAIIGVLSIGGIAGYRYAMNKHKANEWMNNYSLFLTNLKAAYEMNPPNKAEEWTFSSDEFSAVSYGNYPEMPDYLKGAIIEYRLAPVDNAEVCKIIFEEVDVLQDLNDLNIKETLLNGCGLGEAPLDGQDHILENCDTFSNWPVRPYCNYI